MTSRRRQAGSGAGARGRLVCAAIAIGLLGGCAGPAGSGGAATEPPSVETGLVVGQGRTVTWTAVAAGWPVRAVYRAGSEARGPEGERGGAGWLAIERQDWEEGASPERWRIVRSIGPGPDGSWRVRQEQVWVRTAEGHAAIAAEIDRAERVELVYDPPLVMVPASLAGGAGVFEQTTHLRVHPIGNRRVTRAQGEVFHAIRNLGEGPPPGSSSGEPPAQILELKFSATLKPAEVRNMTRQWLRGSATGGDALELVAEQSHERTSVMGIPSRNNRALWLVERE